MASILLVDDQPQNLEALEAILGDLGQNLVKAHSGKEALKAVLTQPFAVILLDVQMPEMDGYETATMIRAREVSRTTPIIFLTAGYKTEEHVKKGYSIGAVDYILKPIVPEILRSKVAVFVELAQKTELLAAANKELESFSYSVSHDLRAPLRTIDGFSLALLEDCFDQLNEGGRGHLRRVREATQQMGELIDDLLNLSRVSRGEIHREPIDLGLLAREVAEELKKMEPARPVQFTIGKSPRAECDRRLMCVVLENLLRNSWKYTSKHPSAKIEFGSFQQNGKPVYFVRDDGAGFDMTFADKLFGAFQRLHSSAEFEGTGVGLATVQRVIHRHGGRIWAEGQVEKGATFYFTIGG